MTELFLVIVAVLLICLSIYNYRAGGGAYGV